MSIFNRFMRAINDKRSDLAFAVVWAILTVVVAFKGNWTGATICLYIMILNYDVYKNKGFAERWEVIANSYNQMYQRAEAMLAEKEGR